MAVMGAGILRPRISIEAVTEDDPQSALMFRTLKSSFFKNSSPLIYREDS